MAAGAAASGDGDAQAASVKMDSSSKAVRRAEDIHKVYPIKKILVVDFLMARILKAGDKQCANPSRSLVQITNAGDESPGYVSTPDKSG